MNRSYRGFICLIQINSGVQIYLIDAIALHDDLHVLNDVFSDPSVEKVMHGCNNDVLWLQRDFRIYLVNVFDTEKACQVCYFYVQIGKILEIHELMSFFSSQVLQKKKRSLGHLVHEYFERISDKSFQVSDWRQRPLSNDQLRYAILDVQYLLSLRDILVEELVDKDLLSQSQSSDLSSLKLAMTKSHETTLATYGKSTCASSSDVASIRIVRQQLGSESSAAFIPLPSGGSANRDSKEHRDLFHACVYHLCVWRDQIARIGAISVLHYQPNIYRVLSRF